MDLITANVITLLAMLSSCFLASLLPSLIHIHADPNSRKKRLITALKRYSNCVSGGVFAGAFFTQFYPHVISSFSGLLAVDSVWMHPLQLGPTLVFAGFLMTALLEMLVDIVLKRLRHSKSARELQERGAHQELQNAPSQAPLVLDDDDSSDDERSSVDTDPLAPSGIAPRSAGVGTRTEKLQVMKVTSRSSSGASRHSHSHSHSTAGHAGHNHSHHHHHDISFDDYQGATRFIVLVASLGTHSIFEGLALGLIKDVQLLMNMFISIIVHEVLMAFALGISLARQKMKLRSRLLFCFIFSVIIPLGQGVGLLIQQAPESGAVTAGRILFQAIAAGTFLHVMFMEILPQEMGSGHFGLAEAFWVAIGYLLIPLSSLISDMKIWQNWKSRLDSSLYEQSHHRTASRDGKTKDKLNY